MTSPLLDLPGAVTGDPPDADVAAHYGDPLREQRMLVAGDGFVDLSHRDVITVAGPDRLRWLHSLLTQELEHLPAGPAGGADALLLSPHGHVEHAIGVVDDGERTWLHVEPDTGPALVTFLDSMRFLLRVEVAAVSGAYAIIWEPASEPHPGYLSRLHPGGLGGRDVFVPRADLAGYANGSGRGPAGIWPYEALRIAAHQPRLGLDTDHRTIPNEVGWLGTAVALDKGCYRGQETVARVHNLGRPPRRLVFLHLDGSVETLPTHGAAVEHEGRQVGTVGSAARHYELGPIALAMVKRSLPVDAPLLAGGVAATQEPIVDPDTGLHFRASRSLRTE